MAMSRVCVSVCVSTFECSLNSSAFMPNTQMLPQLFLSNCLFLGKSCSTKIDESSMGSARQGRRQSSPQAKTIYFAFWSWRSVNCQQYICLRIFSLLFLFRCILTGAAMAENEFRHFDNQRNLLLANGRVKVDGNFLFW